MPVFITMIIAAAALIPSEGHCYIDPGTGHALTMSLSALIGSLALVGAAIGGFALRLISRVRSKKKKPIQK